MEELLRGRFAGSGEERVDKREKCGEVRRGRSTEMKELEDEGRMEKKSGEEVEERSVQVKTVKEEEEGGRYWRCLEIMEDLLRGRCTRAGEMTEDGKERSREARGRRCTEVMEQEDEGRKEKNSGKGSEKRSGKEEEERKG